MDPAASSPAKSFSTFTPQEDSSKFIRTFAKDFAALSGQAAVMGTPLPQPKPVTVVAPEETTVTEGGVSTAGFDPSPVNHAEAASPKEFEQEVVDLKESDSEGIFGKLGIFSGGHRSSTVLPEYSTPLMPQTTIAPAQKVEPTDVPLPAPSPIVETPLPDASTPLPPAPTPAEADADREAILARLRAKVSAERAVTATAPIVVDLPLRTAAPDFASLPEPVMPMPQPRRKMPQQAAAPETLSPLHTYSSDFATRIDSASGSTFSVLAAQSDAGQTPRPSSARKRTIIPLLAGGAMLVVGVAAITGAYLFTRQASVPMVAGVPSLIQFDEAVEVKGSSQELMQAISNVGQGGSVSGNVIVTYGTLATTTGSGIPQAGGALIRNMNLSAPDILLRNIDDSSTVGVVRAGNESRPFMILKVNSYERTFAGMLAWEPSMATDLATFYPAYSIATNASGTPVVLPPAPTAFSDAVVANYDVRILRDASGRSLMLYGYRGKDLLIVARDEAAFTALLSRLSAAGK